MMSSSQPLPSTPRKRDSTVDDVILKLNADYSLGLQLPDPSITPQRRKELAREDSEYARWTKIHHCIRLLSFKDHGLLHKVIHSFGLEVDAESQNWFPRFQMGRDQPTAGQRLKMQNMLLTVLESAMKEFQLPLPRSLDANTQPVSRTAQYTNMNASFPQPTPPRVSYSRASVSPSRERSERKNSKRAENNHDGGDQYVTSRMQSSVRQQPVFAQPVLSAQKPRTKRPSLEAEDADDDSSPKRRKGDAERPASSMVDVIPSRRRYGNSPTPRLLHSESTGTSNNSNNSNLSISRVCWDDMGDEQMNTQTTMDPDSPSQKVAQKSTTMLRDTHAPPVKKTTYPPSATLILPSKKRRPAGTIEDPISLEEPEPAPTIQRQYPTSPTLTGTVYSSVPGMEDCDHLWNLQSQSQSQTRAPEPESLEARLQDIWPKFPHWLHKAPFGLAWELTRICLHCRVDLDNPLLRYKPAWATQTMNDIWRELREHDLFRGKSFPERPSADAFAAALSGSFESKGNMVVLAATLDFNPEVRGPLFLVDLKPLRLDQGCRLTRRFGPDRFFEILFPNPTSKGAPKLMQDPGAADKVMKWMSGSPHSVLGRVWRGFYMKDAGYRQPSKEFRLSPEAQKPIVKDRIHLFAESGHQFRPIIVRSQTAEPPPDTQRADERTEFKVSQMLDWLLELKKNDHQPYLKLFSRIQLGLSKTFPIMVFEHHQIHNHEKDILSPTGKVMNDGIGRMSRSVAKKIRDVLGLADIPSAVQGRMGPAKGMWLMDVSDTGDGDWIETYPSQRKWVCGARDPHQRTLEVRSVASELKSAGLNLQFLPVLEDRAKDPVVMRQAIATRLTNDLQKQFESQKAAFKRPLQFRQWMTENFSGRGNRVNHGHVPFLAGLPESKEEVMNFLLNSGFDPKKQKYLQELAWDLQKQKCDTLRTKLNVKVGRSAYVYMVVDFWGVLEENEVHLGFSSKFRDETDDTSYTLLADCDVLVARSPAHFPSDVQKVRAVFKSELHALKDVIVFSAKGNIPLADKLSGGDYDGDLAWVCWDEDIVDSFTNAEVPEQPDLSSYLKKNKTTFKELVGNTAVSGRASLDKAVYDMINKSFQFSMQPNFLGICTNFKERLCYQNNSVSNDAAIILSTLVGNLVDQSKQGIEFPKSSWDKLRRDQFPAAGEVPDPAYKKDSWVGKEQPRHIIDFLKFSVAKPAIDAELKALHLATTQSRSGNGSQGGPEAWDPELVCYYESFKAIGDESKSTRGLLDSLVHGLSEVSKKWKQSMARAQAKNSSAGFNYQKEVCEVYDLYRALTPKQMTTNGTKVDSKMVRLLDQSFLPDPELSYWALVKASTAFKFYYKSNPKFVWQMAGRQLAFIKAQMASGGDGVPALVTPLMYAGLAPDQKFVKQYTARLDGEGSEYPDEDEIDLLERDDDD